MPGNVAHSPRARGSGPPDKTDFTDRTQAEVALAAFRTALAWVLSVLSVLSGAGRLDAHARGLFVVSAFRAGHA